MKHLVVLLSATLLSLFSTAQTCVGVFNLHLYDVKTKKVIKDEVVKTIWYVHNMPEDVFYDEAHEIQPLDSIFINQDNFLIYHNKAGHQFFKSNEPSAASFSTKCGLYLVQAEFIMKKDTMRIGFYNIPAHQSFQIDTVYFKKGNYYLDLKASQRLSEFKFEEDKGYFTIPSSLLIVAAKKED